MLPILRLTGDGNDHSLTEMRERIAKDLKLSDAELVEHYAGSSQAVFPHRIRWAVQWLKESEAVQWVRRSVYRITDRGSLLLKEGLSEITESVLERFPEFQDFRQKLSAPNETSSPVPGAEAKDWTCPHF